MKIKEVKINNRKKCFELTAADRIWLFPFSKLNLKPGPKNRIATVSVDTDFGDEGFTYALDSGKEATVPMDAVLEYNKHPEHMRDILLYQLTVDAKKIIAQKGIAKNEIIRRMDTSQTQFYRLIDTANYHKTIDQMVKLLAALDCQVSLHLKKDPTPKLRKTFAAKRRGIKRHRPKIRI